MKKKEVKEVKPKVKKIEEVKLEELIEKGVTKMPIVVEVISAPTEKRIIPTFNKMEVLTTVPLLPGNVRVIVLQDHNGMLDNLRTGDIIDVPDRRYKTLAMRGLVKEYKGDGQPNKRR